MEFCYIVMQTRSQAFNLENRLRSLNICCEISQMPKGILKDLCNVGVKFNMDDMDKVMGVLNWSGFPSWKLYREEMTGKTFDYHEICGG